MSLLLLITVNQSAIAIPGDSLRVIGVLLEGNKITRDEIIYRELTFKSGDIIAKTDLSSVLDSSKQNLSNTFLFNFVTLTPEYTEDSLNILIKIDVSERWYWWPEPVFTLVDINFSQWLKTRDMSKVTYGLILTRKNFRGRNETISVGLQQGFSERYSFQYTIPYINRRLKDGISVSTSFLRSKQALYTTIGSKPFYLKGEDYIRKDYSVSFLYRYRRGFYHTTSVYTGYRFTQISDTILEANEFFFLSGKNTQRYFHAGIFFVDDHRDFHAYPLRGYFASIDVAKLGLPFLNDDIDNISLITTLKGYLDLGHKFYVAGSGRVRLTNKSKQSFFNLAGIGTGSSGIHGYENYFILGQNTYLLKSALKYNLMPERVLYFNFVPIDKFSRVPLALFLNFFADAAYVEDRYYFRPGDLSNQFLHGYGVGLDLVTYYDLILRFEYSFNKFGENGLFIHFSSPI